MPLLFTNAAAAAVGGPSTYLGQTCTNCRVPNVQTDIGKTRIVSHTSHIARERLIAPQALLGNWVGTYDQGEPAMGAPSMHRLSIEYPIGSRPQYFMAGGSNTIAIADGAEVLTDPLPLSVTVPAGQRFRLHRLWDCVNGFGYTNYYPGGEGEGSTFGPIAAVADTTDGVGIAGLESRVAAPPLALVQATVRPSVLLLGDSRVQGRSDAGETGDASSDSGNLARAVGRALGYINAGCSTLRVASMSDSGFAKRRALLRHASHVVIAAGINDLFGGASAAAVLESLRRIVAQLKAAEVNKPVHVCTVSPATNSSDSFATPTGAAGVMGNQSPAGGWDMETQRQTLNAAIRASGVAEADGWFDLDRIVSAYHNAPVWLGGADREEAGGGPRFTSDGIHENRSANLAIAQSGVVPLAMFERS